MGAQEFEFIVFIKLGVLNIQLLFPRFTRFSYLEHIPTLRVIHNVAATNSTQLGVLEAIAHINTDSDFKCVGYEGLRSAARKNIPV